MLNSSHPCNLINENSSTFKTLKVFLRGFKKPSRNLAWTLSFQIWVHTKASWIMKNHFQIIHVTSTTLSFPSRNRRLEQFNTCVQCLVWLFHFSSKLADYLRYFKPTPISGLKAWQIQESLPRSRCSYTNIFFPVEIKPQLLQIPAFGRASISAPPSQMLLHLRISFASTVS